MPAVEGGGAPKKLADYLQFPPAKVDRVLKDGHEVKLGDAVLVAHLTPGHTRGCTTWTMAAVEGGKTYQVAFVCSVTVNDGVHLVGNTRVPAIADHYAQSFRVLHGLKPDIFVAQHGSVFGLEEKARRAGARSGAGGHADGSNPFVDRDGYQRFVDSAEQAYLKQLAAERKR